MLYGISHVRSDDSGMACTLWFVVHAAFSICIVCVCVCHKGVSPCLQKLLVTLQAGSRQFSALSRGW